MKRFLVAFLSLVAVSAFAQNISIEKADGSQILIPTVAPPGDDVIVEFFDPPLAYWSAATTSSLSKAAAKPPHSKDYRAAFTRFRADLSSVSRRAEVRWEYFRVFNGASVRVPRSDVAALARLPYVKQIHADHEMHTMAGPAVAQIGADTVWTTYGSRGKGVVVAIIDTGVDYTHEALGKGIGPGFKVAGGYDFANKDADPMDDNGHGTHVAGIVAGDSSTITGIAPDATLMAFKALRASGSGSESDVIAAIERAADPNGDGDTSDHVDVVNLSLGGSGGPDDAGSRAVDNGTQLGIVFCIAAGNAGRYHSVASPGTARRAITVGAVDSVDVIAGFSSRGPTPKDLTMKPEVVAPGVSITSSFPGNRYGAASGTSMATPHAAGAAALLKSVHPDWTPAQIKMALMLTAFPKNQEVMSVGAGRIDAAAAAGGTVAIDQPSINFGLDPIQQPMWSQSRTIQVTNNGEQSVTWTLSTSPAVGVTATVSPQSLTLGAGASGEVTLAIDVDNATVAVGPQSFSTAGVVTLASPTGNVHVPWSLVKAVRATVTWEKEFATILWLDATRSAFLDSAAIDANVSETLLAGAGDYDLIVFGSTVDDKTNALSRASFIYREKQHLDGDITIATTEAQASHVIRGSTTTPDGKPVQITPDQTYAMSGRLVWPAGTAVLASLSIPPLPLREIHVNDVAEGNKLFFNEAYVDFRGNALYAMQHPALNGLKGDIALTAGNFKSVPVQLLLPASQNNLRIIVVQVVPAIGASGLAVARPTTDTLWNGRVFITPDVDPKYSAGMTFFVVTDGVTRYLTPQLHLIDGEITTNSTSSAPRRLDSGTFIFGGGPRLASVSFTNINALFHPSLFVDFFGPHGEARQSERTQTVVVTFGADGKQKSSVTLYPAPLDLATKGAYTLEATNNATQYPDIPQQTKLTLKLDSSRADYVPPTLTALYLVDGAGDATRTVPPHSASALYFSAADYSYTPSKTYQQIRADATTLSYRYAGTTAWTPLGVAQMSEDPVAGILYRADLSAAANVDWARVDLKIDLADNAGNTTSVVMQPAFSVGPEYPPRRHAAR
jgi:hypothetical protein